MRCKKVVGVKEKLFWLCLFKRKIKGSFRGRCLRNELSWQHRLVVHSSTVISGNCLHSPVRWQNTNFAKTKCRVPLVKLYFHTNNLAASRWPSPRGDERRSSCGITCCHLPGCEHLRWLRSSHVPKSFAFMGEISSWC